MKEPPDRSAEPAALETLVTALAGLGCPPTQCRSMAGQLDRRARQLAELKGRSYDEALRHLLTLMAQGWAAQAQSGSSGVTDR